MQLAPLLYFTGAEPTTGQFDLASPLIFSPYTPEDTIGAGRTRKSIAARAIDLISRVKKGSGPKESLDGFAFPKSPRRSRAPASGPARAATRDLGSMRYAMRLSRSVEIRPPPDGFKRPGHPGQ